MKFLFAFSLAAFISVYSYCQDEILINNIPLNVGSSKLTKSIVDKALITQWPRNYGAFISNDGEYVASVERNLQLGTQWLVVQSVRKDWKKQFINASCLFFAANSKQLVFTREDSVFCWQLGGAQVTYITNLASNKFPEKNPGEWIACQQKGDRNTLVLRNLLNEKENRFESVSNYAFNDSGTALFIEKNEGNRTLLQLLNLKTQTLSDVYHGQINSISSISLDESGQQLLFTVKDSSITAAGLANETYSIWYYREGMKEAVLNATNRTSGIEHGLYIQPDIKFSKDGRYIFFSLRGNGMKAISAKGAVNVNIWNYKDSVIQSAQLASPIEDRTYLCVIPVGNCGVEKIFRLEYQNDMVVAYPEKGDFVVVRNDNDDDRGDRKWLPYKCTFNLISLQDGTSTLLSNNAQGRFQFSPANRYLVWFDGVNEQYFSYDLNLKQQINISRNVPKGWLSSRDEYDKPGQTRYPVDDAMGWLPDDRGIFVYDNYDVWLLDVSGKNPAINMTSGYGRGHQIKFKAINTESGKTITSDSLILAAYNTRTKYNGFYRIALFKKVQPELLTMGPYAYYHWQQTGIREKFDGGSEPVKARQSNAWVVSRQSFNEVPNYFLTYDFKDYQPLTDLQPLTGYNWLTAELVNFKQLDGSMSQGILYKPENFDPKKKYPVLMNFYRHLSGRLYECPIPELTGSAFLNIPWFVSRGYLVFTPDIYFTHDEIGPSAYNSVVGAAKFLSKMPFIDSTKIGIAGHSFGGGITNYLVTHTNFFAAAFEGAGESDKIRRVFELPNRRGSPSGLDYLQKFKPFWENADPWIKNSPIFQVDKVTTPLLMFHCRADEAVMWDQAPPLFLALRYLNKKVWLIEYDDGDHGVFGKNAEDLAIRVTQYFDHLLKHTPAPVWMTQGINAAMKGIETGYKLDPSGSCAMKGNNTCKVCEKWNEQFKRTPEMFAKPLSEWHLDKDLGQNQKLKSAPKATK